MAGDTVNRDPKVTSHITSGSSTRRGREQSVRSSPFTLPSGTRYTSPGPTDGQAILGIQSEQVGGAGCVEHLDGSPITRITFLAAMVTWRLRFVKT